MIHLDRTFPLRPKCGAWLRLLLVVALVLLSAGADVQRASGQDLLPTGAPVRLVIPSLSLDADVGWFDLGADLSMPAPDSAGLVAWYTYSAPAGGRGNAVLSGHRDWQGQRGVFYQLGDIQTDGEIWLQDAAANWYLYTVSSIASYETDNAPIAEITGFTGVPSLTLITCTGVFNPSTGSYAERQVVRAELSFVLPAEPQE